MLWEISLLIISIAFAALIVFIVPAAIQFRRTAKKVEIIADSTNQYLPDILRNVDEITANLNQMVSYGREQVTIIGNAVGEVRSVVDDVIRIERDIKAKIEDPIVEILSTLTAVTRALRTFLNTFKR